MPFGDPQDHMEGGGSSQVWFHENKPVRTCVEVLVSGDHEIDVISLCIAALNRLSSDDDRLRVANYVCSRVAGSEAKP